MKRHLMLELKKIYPDYSTKTPKELEIRVGKLVRIVGDIIVGKSLELHFEDGYKFKTSPLDVEGFINYYGSDDNLTDVALCTKNMAYEFKVIDNG